MFRKTTATIVLCGSLLLAGGAMAAPPSVDQYTEQVPTPGGDKPANEVEPSGSADGSGSGDDQGGSASPGSGSGVSNGSGGSGESAPDEAAGTGSSPGSGASSGSASDSDNADGGTTKSAVADGLENAADDSGMGLIFPLIFAVALVLTVVILVLRRRGAFDSRAT